MHVNLLWKSNGGSELRSCALYSAFEHFGNTGENIKRMQGTRESPKISVIEINSCEVRPTNCCNAIAQVFAFCSRLGGMISVNFDVSPIIVVFPYPSVDCSHI